MPAALRLLLAALLLPSVYAQTAPPTSNTSTTYPRPQAVRENTPAPPPPTPTRTEILRGAYGPYRANNDLLYYHLDVRVDPVTKTIAGMNTVRFKMLTDGTRIQLDLSEILVVEKIMLGKEELVYTRDSGAVFIDFPRTLHAGQTYSIDFYYSGAPKAKGRFG